MGFPTSNPSCEAFGLFLFLPQTRPKIRDPNTASLIAGFQQLYYHPCSISFVEVVVAGETMASNMCMELATSSGHLGMKLECPFQKNFEIFSRRIDKHSKIKQRRPGSWFSTNARNAKFAAAPSLRMESNGYSGRKNYTQSNDKIYERLDSCLVIPPPNGKKPRAIVKFLGGAFIGAVPEATYG